MKFVEWIKTHKLISFLIVVILFLLFKSSNSPRINSLSFPTMNSAVNSRGLTGKMTATDSVGSFSESMALPAPEVAPQPGISNRMVVQESNLSLLVKNVIDTRNKILEYTKQAGGYMISASTSNPQDAPTSTVEIRIPSDKISEALDYLHTLAVKIVSENLAGYDVTDQYVDIEKRIGYLQQTIDQYQSILRQAKEITDIANLTERIISTQSQIDSLKGSQDAMKKKSETAKITIYLSTDEMALPYAPSETWRPDVIFKQAVRSLVADLRKLGTTFIWLAVYAIIWIPILLVVVFIKRRFFNK